MEVPSILWGKLLVSVNGINSRLVSIRRACADVIDASPLDMEGE
jgi:hypothetical protein